MSEIDEEKLFSELSAKWAAEAREKPKLRLSEADQQVARKLMGTANAERVAHAKEGRRVRITPVVTIVEYWWVRSRDLLPDTWHFDRIVNHRKEEKVSGRDPEELERRLADYRRQNIPVRRVYLEGERREEPHKAIAKRKSFRERYEGFGR